MGGYSDVDLFLSDFCVYRGRISKQVNSLDTSCNAVLLNADKPPRSDYRWLLWLERSQVSRSFMGDRAAPPL